MNVPTQPYDLTKIMSLRRTLFDQAFFEHLGTRLDGVSVRQLATIVHRVLPNSHYPAVYDSLAYLAGQIFTEQIAKDTAWRLAANRHRLRAGDAILPWSGQAQPEWVPVHVLSMITTQNWKKEIAGEFVFRIVAGSSCPLGIVKVWSSRFCSMMGRHIGFTNRRGSLPYHDMSELVNLRFRVLITPELSRQAGKPDFEKISCSGALLEWNKEVIGKRRRLYQGKSWPCPKGYSHQCFQCHVGYNECLPGCHPHTAAPRQTHATVPPTASAHSG